MACRLFSRPQTLRLKWLLYALHAKTAMQSVPDAAACNAPLADHAMILTFIDVVCDTLNAAADET
jgi:hypothetical protein